MQKAVKIGLVIAGGLAVALAILALIVMKQESVVFETYLIPSTVKEGWITVEYDNPKCPALPRGSRRVFEISEAGYFCTSTPRNKRPFYHWYYLVDEKGNRTRLMYEEKIFHRMSVYLDPISENPTCKRVVADVFWYGKEQTIDNQDAAALQKRHPECTGIIVPFSSPRASPKR